MYAIAFDLSIENLKIEYGTKYHTAYYEIKQLLRDFEFYNVQGSVYQSPTASLVDLYDAIDALRMVTWFPKSCRDIRAYRVEEWSDFTDSVKGQKRKRRDKNNMIEK